MTRVRVTPSSLDPRKPYKFVTVSPYPDMARLMVKRFAEAMGDSYVIIHAANCEYIEELRFRVRDLQPDLVVWSSSWTSEQIKAICTVTRNVDPNVDICGLPEDQPTQKSVEMLLLRLRGVAASLKE